MKSIKKVFTLLLAAVMVMSLSVTAFATSDGSITITNATEGQKYEVYKLFDATHSGENVSYTITETDNNSDFIAALKSDDSVFKLTASTDKAKDYSVTLKDDTENDAVITYIKSIANLLGDVVASTTAEGTTVKFTGLDSGYYYVTSTLGTLVTIDSALKDVEIRDKNTAPSNVKTVEEDSTNEYGGKNTADLYQTVNFKSTITAYVGAKNYVFHDTMPDGLTFDNASVTVTAGETILTAGKEYTLITETSDNCTFEIKFSQDYLNTISEKTTIVIDYSANVNKDANIGSEGNINTSLLSYADDNYTVKTPASTTTTYVYEFDLVKYTGTTSNVLDNAEFTLSLNDTPLAFVYDEDNATYTLAGENDSNTTTTITAGSVNIEGLDADIYVLTETKAPDGYNPLDDTVTIKIDDEGIVTYYMTKTGNSESSTGTVYVENNSGTKLPQTGGIGTKIFYVTGTIMVIGAAILLITRKRMKDAQD